MGKSDAVREILASSFENNDLKLPGNVRFVLEKNQTQCRIKLNPKKVQTENMQTDANAFEAWAVALHIALDKPNIIILDVDGEFETIPYEMNGHWGRFLYRALRFSQQYKEWFKLSEQIEPIVKAFEEYLESNYFTNNLPNGEAGIKEKHGAENIVEAKFAEDRELQKKFNFFVSGNKVYRQLPVGLFRIEGNSQEEKKSYKYSKEMMIFTGGKSAIDLWTWNKDEFEVIELKTNNPMMGIITEIFFYSNYMYDFLVRAKWRFILNNISLKKKGNDRGYSNIPHILHGDGFRKICGIMLADKYHPILENAEVLAVLNDRKREVDIEYIKADYEYELIVDKKEWE